MKKALLLVAMCVLPALMYAGTNPSDSNSQTVAEKTAAALFSTALPVNNVQVTITEETIDASSVYAYVNLEFTYPVTADITVTIGHYPPNPGSTILYDSFVVPAGQVLLQPHSR